MKKQTRAFLNGMLVAALTLGLCVSALAISGRMTIEVDPINIQVNGEVFQPKDVNGNDVPVFAYNGTTYAPLRALAEAYGLEVGYDATTNLATVDSHKNVATNEETNHVVKASNVTINRTEVSLTVGETTNLTATVKPANASDKVVVWESSDTSVVTVDNGFVTAKQSGTAIITATVSDSVSASCTVTVSKVGTLGNPIMADGKTTISYNRFSRDPVQNIKIECTKVVTGSAANSLAYSENPFNDKPNSNQEWRFYEFNVTYVSCEDGSDSVLKASSIISDDTFFTTSGSSAKVAETATLSNNYDGYGIYDVEMYPGASSKIVIGILIEKGAGDLLLRVPSNRGKDNTWLMCKP